MGADRYPHGERARYVLGGCRCFPCRVANADYSRMRASDPATEPAGATRDYLRKLSASGVGRRRIAELAGVSKTAIDKLLSGRSRRVSRRVAEAIQGTPLTGHADGALVDAGETWRLIAELRAAGVPKVRIAEAIGQRRALQLARTTVTVGSARRVRVFHDAVLMEASARGAALRGVCECQGSPLRQERAKQAARRQDHRMRARQKVSEGIDK